MKKFELQISWTMTATVHVEAETEEEATRSALTARCTDGGSFLPSSIKVDSVEVAEADGTNVPAKLLRVK